MEKILNDLPSVLRKEYHKIWLEYQTRETQESVFVHEIDKLEMAFQAIEYLKKGHSKKNLQTFIDSAKTEIKNEHLRNILNKLLESMK
jgi:putative hydrolase of HD superfamily